MQKDLGRRDAAAIVLASYLWFLLLIVAFDSYPSRVVLSGDNRWYALDSAAIRGLASPPPLARHFVGYPLLAAPVAAILHIDDVYALPLVSIPFSLLAIFLASELWGAWAATWFAIINLDWIIQRSLLGGAEPLFAALIFAALLAARRERWNMAALFGAVATVVRSLGIVVLLALGIELIRARRPRSLLIAISISVAIGVAYLWIVGAVFGNPAGNFHWYRQMGLGHDRTFVPFVTIFLSFRDQLITAKNLAKTLAWMSVTLAAIIAAVRRPEMRAALTRDRVEWLFATIYVASFLLFPAWWIEGEFPRYLVPVIPMLFVALRPWLPSDRRILGTIGILSATLAAVEDMPWFSRALSALLP